MSVQLDLEMAGQIARRLGLREYGLRCRPMTGGDIASAWLVETQDQKLFVKLVPIRDGGVLSAEADGLTALAKTGAVRVPRVIGKAHERDVAWLALEYLQLNRRSEDADRRLGQALAKLHRHGSDHFGWSRNNYIGLTPQPNPVEHDWATFFLWHRIGPQLDRLENKNSSTQWGHFQRPLFETWQQHFRHHRPEPALIHGDLWSGNAAIDEEGDPVLYDPAVHYADRECDLAMTHLFGGFSQAFYQTYEDAWPMPDGHEQRRPWYQLYHLLNHANLFGCPYLDRTERLIRRLINQTP